MRQALLPDPSMSVDAFVLFKLPHTTVSLISVSAARCFKFANDEPVTSRVSALEYTGPLYIGGGPTAMDSTILAGEGCTTRR